MAVLHKKEEKIQAVLGRLPKTYTHEQFVAMFIQLFSRDWGRIKSAYIKQTQDKEPGTVVHMPKPELYLKQVLENFLSQKQPLQTEVPKVENPKIVEVTETTAEVETDAKPKKAVKKVAKAEEELVTVDETEKPKKKAVAKKAVEKLEEEPITEPKKSSKKVAPKAAIVEADEESGKKPAKEKIAKEKKVSTKK